EAQAMGRPVVATAHGGSCETIEPGVTGWLVPPRDPAALAEAIGRALVLGESERARFANRAMAHVAGRDSRQASGAVPNETYEELLCPEAGTLREKTPAAAVA